MGELESGLGRLVRIFFTKVLLTWWRSLDDAGKSNFEFGVAVLSGVAILLFAMTELRKRQVAIQVPSPKPTIDLKHYRQALVVRTASLQDQLSPYWRILKGEVRIGGLLCLGFLALAAFGSWPYNFYVLTRIIVCFTFACFAVLLHRYRRFAWEAAVALWALLFNPVAPFHFDKDTWQLFNVAALITLISSLFVYARMQLTIETETLIPLKVKTLEAVSAAKSESKPKNGAYRYCESCSVRVGLADAFCKRCGEALG
jgi:hypothetical protein